MIDVNGAFVLESPWVFDSGQTMTLQNRLYNVHAAILLSKDIEEFALEIRFIDKTLPSLCTDRYMDFIEHVKAVLDADLSYPIILNEFGGIIDGRHRLAKAIIEGHRTIQCVQFCKDPAAIYEVVNYDY